MAFYINGTERTGRTKVFTCTATDTFFNIDNRYLPGIWIISYRRYHLDGIHRTMACTVSAIHIIRQHHTVLAYPYGMTDMNSRFVGLRNRTDSTGRAYFRTFRTFRTAISPLVRHFRLHQSHQILRRMQNLARTG